MQSFRRRNTKKNLQKRAKKYPSVSYEIADQIQQVTGSEVRITVPGHMQRGGEPCAYDRVLSTRIGAGAAQAIMDEEYGVMIGVVNGKIKTGSSCRMCRQAEDGITEGSACKSSQTDRNQLWRLINYKSSGRRGSVSAATVAKRRSVL